MRIGIGGRALVDQVKGQYNFFTEGYSVCVLKRYDGTIIKHDLSAQAIDFLSWISHNSIKSVEYLDPETVDVQQTIGTSMLLLFVDKDQAASKVAISTLE